MDIFLIIISFLCILLAIIGSILPVLPGPLVGFIGLLLLHFTSSHPFSRSFLIIWALIIAIMAVLEYFIPIRWTKRFWWSKGGARGSTIGLIIAVIVLPILWITIGPFGLLGLIAGPFLGAYLGEKMAGREHQHALRSAVGSFIGFLTWTFLKLVVCLIIAGYFLGNVYGIVFK